MEENANKVHLKCSDFNSSMRVAVYAECILCVNRTFIIFSIQRLIIILVKCGWLWKEPVVVWAFFGSVNYAYIPQLFQQLINTVLCPAFLMIFVCQPVCCVPLQIQTFFIKILSSLLNTTLNVVKHCSDVCCEEFLEPQIDHTSK